MAAHTVRTEEPTKRRTYQNGRKPTRAAHRITVQYGQNGGILPERRLISNSFYQSQELECGVPVRSFRQEGKRKREKERRKPGALYEACKMVPHWNLVFGHWYPNGVRGRTARIGSDFGNSDSNGGSHKQRADHIPIPTPRLRHRLIIQFMLHPMSLTSVKA